MSEPTAVATPPTTELTVPKAELDNVKGQLTQTSQSLEAMRNQLLAPEYLEFLEAKKGPSSVSKPTMPTNLGSMSIDDLRKFIEETSQATVKSVIAPLAVRMNDVQAKQELVDVQARHADFKDYSDQVVAILEANPKSDITIEQAYWMAKGARSEAPKAEAQKADAPQAPQGEKPGATVPLSNDVIKTFKDGEAAGQAAWREVASKYNLKGDSI